MKYIHLFILFLLILNCSSGDIYTAGAKKLNAHKAVAIMQVDIVFSEVPSIMGSISNQMKADIMSREERERSHSKNQADDYKDITSDIISGKMLKRGLKPVERNKMALVFKEISFQQKTGAESRNEIGKLTGADCIYTSSLNISLEQGLISNKYVYNFSGKLISVSDGSILASGAVSISKSDLNTSYISEVVSDWFSGIDLE